MRTAHDPAYQVRKFKCNQCDSDFKTKPDLNKHIKRLHMGLGKNYKCEECNKAYQRRSQLLVHMHYKHTKHMFVKKCPGIIIFNSLELHNTHIFKLLLNSFHKCKGRII